MPKSKSSVKSITNRRAKFDYSIKDNYLVGIVLNGAETRALRQNRGNLKGAYVTVKDNELWLTNVTIVGDSAAPIDVADQTKSRKLLAKKQEIDRLIEAKNQGLTIIPTDILTGGHYIKVRIVTGMGKKRYDKRQTIKTRDEERRIRRYEHNA
jgi:SsrA-binding protein